MYTKLLKNQIPANILFLEQTSRDKKESEQVMEWKRKRIKWPTQIQIEWKLLFGVKHKRMVMLNHLHEINFNSIYIVMKWWPLLIHTRSKSMRDGCVAMLFLIFLFFSKKIFHFFFVYLVKIFFVLSEVLSYKKYT